MFQWIGEKKRPPIDRRRSLEAVPVLNDDVTIRKEGERTCVTVRLRRARKGLIGRLLPPTMERTLRLDELGSFVLRQIDGQRNVFAIIDEFATTYRVNRREAELSTAEFLRSLAERQVISLVVQ